MDIEQEIERLNVAVDEFAAWMKERLAEKAREGYGGWDELQGIMPRELTASMFKDAGLALSLGPANVKSVLFIDIANRAMMLHRWSQEQA